MISSQDLILCFFLCARASCSKLFLIIDEIHHCSIPANRAGQQGSQPKTYRKQECHRRNFEC